MPVGVGSAGAALDTDSALGSAAVVAGVWATLLGGTVLVAGAVAAAALLLAAVLDADDAAVLVVAADELVVVGAGSDEPHAAAAASTAVPDAARTVRRARARGTLVTRNPPGRSDSPSKLGQSRWRGGVEEATRRAERGPEYLSTNPRQQIVRVHELVRAAGAPIHSLCTVPPLTKGLGPGSGGEPAA